MYFALYLSSINKISYMVNVINEPRINKTRMKSFKETKKLVKVAAQIMTSNKLTNDRPL